MARFLLIEDNIVNLELMRYLLTAFGHEVLTATGGEAALALLEHATVNVVACDLHMPRMDGQDVLRALRARPTLADLPVVAVTASAMVGVREHLLAAGFDGYISKPIDPETFVAQLAAFVPTSRPPTRLE